VILSPIIAVLARLPSKMLKTTPTPPLLQALLYVDTNMSTCSERNVNDPKGFTALHYLAEMSDPRLECIAENQCILGRQRIEHGANVNARAHKARQCCWGSADGYRYSK
jgi:hypothetical protein